MAEHIEEEQLDPPSNTHSENLSGNTIPATNTEIITPNQATENMEVHHHPHAAKKNFREYLLEGLMIFVAVTLGFFAESFREHLVNKEREKQYINAFYQDLQSDQKDLPLLINSINGQQMQTGEALPHLISNATTTSSADSIYYCLRRFIRQQGIKAFITDKTNEQIKNAGEMRLLTNKQITDRLAAYYKEIIMIDYLQQTLLGLKSKLIDNVPLILKSTDYTAAINSKDQAIIPTHPVHLLSTDPLVMNRILIEVEDIRALSNTILREIDSLLKDNNEIQNLIKTKYEIEN